MTIELIDEMIKCPERFLQQEYGNLTINDENNCFEVICNNQYISTAEEANSKEGWCKVVVFELDTFIMDKSSFKTNRPYLTMIDGNLEIAKTTLYGDVKIFKIDHISGLPIRR